MILKEGVANSEHKRIFKNARAKQTSISSCPPARSVRGELCGGGWRGGLNIWEECQELLTERMQTATRQPLLFHRGRWGELLQHHSVLWATCTQGKLFALAFLHKAGILTLVEMCPHRMIVTLAWAGFAWFGFQTLSIDKINITCWSRIGHWIIIFTSLWYDSIQF